MACHPTKSDSCYCYLAEAKGIDEIVLLTVQEGYCHPVLTYSIIAVKLTVKLLDELNACWCTVYGKIFGFIRRGSDKCFISGLGHIVLHHELRR
jgi:hypothetical protein